MNESEILSQLTLIFRDIFRNDTLLVTPELTAKEVEKWDSLAHVDMLALVEEKFNIRIPSWEMVNLKNVTDLIQCIKRQSEQ